jgi:hypothetical protein
MRAMSVELADQRRPDKSPAHAAGLHAHGLGHALDDERVDLRQLAAGLRVDLDAAGVLEGVHREEGIGNRLAHDQQAVVAQHQEVGGAQVGLQARLLVVAQGHAFVVVVRQRGQHEGRLLADGQHAALLRADGHAGARVRVQHAAGVGARLVHALWITKPAGFTGKGESITLLHCRRP